MTYNYIIEDKLRKKLQKLGKKNRDLLAEINKKIFEICKDPSRCKNLNAPKNHLKRVHVRSHFVLLFSVNEVSKTIVIEDFEHHDKVYL